MDILQLVKGPCIEDFRNRVNNNELMFTKGIHTDSAEQITGFQKVVMSGVTLR